MPSWDHVILAAIVKVILGIVLNLAAIVVAILGIVLILVAIKCAILGILCHLSGHYGGHLGNCVNFSCH